MPVLLKTYNIFKLNNILAIVIFYISISDKYSKCKDSRPGSLAWDNGN